MCVWSCRLVTQWSQTHFSLNLKSSSVKLFWALCTPDCLIWNRKLFLLHHFHCMLVVMLLEKKKWCHTLAEPRNELAFTDVILLFSLRNRNMLKNGDCVNNGPCCSGSNVSLVCRPTCLSVSFPAVGCCVGGKTWMEQAKWKSLRVRMAKSDKWFLFKNPVNTQQQNNHSGLRVLSMFTWSSVDEWAEEGARFHMLGGISQTSWRFKTSLFRRDSLKYKNLICVLFEFLSTVSLIDITDLVIRPAYIIHESFDICMQM